MKIRRLNNYLEIGVRNGHIFFRIKSKFKIAVDPEFGFDPLRKTVKILLNGYNIYNKYINKTSDDFFSEDAPLLFETEKVELALIDGMHEYSFALRDVENTLKYLDERGVVVMHDCNPETEDASCSFDEWKARGFTGVWNGDVWKAILHLRSLRNDLNVFVLDCDHGLGIVTKGVKNNNLSFSESDIKKLTYKDLELHRKEWLGLMPAEYFHEFFGIK